MQDNLIIAKIKKNSSREVWISINHYKGKLRVDVREYFQSDDEPDWHPTKKGVSIPPEEIREAIDAVDKLAQEDKVCIVSEIDRGDRAKLRLSICQFNKHVYADLRIFYLSKDGSEWKPGKGVTLPPSKLTQLTEALRFAEEQLKGI